MIGEDAIREGMEDKLINELLVDGWMKQLDINWTTKIIKTELYL